MRPRGATASPPTPTLGRGRPRRGWLGIILAVGVSWSPARQAHSQDLAGATRELSDLESDTQRLTADDVRRHDRKSSTFVEERLTDGELYLRLGDYLRAAILLTDIVEHYPTHRAYPEALFLLGESLFLGGDYLGARKRYAEVIDRSGEPTFSPFLERALSRFIEIAIQTRDLRDVDAYFARLEALGTSALSVSTAYFRAKYLYHRAVSADDTRLASANARKPVVDEGRLEQARRGFLAIPRGTDYSLRARYFAGTIHILRGEYLDAIAAFESVLGSEPTNAEEAEVVELTYLALGRLYYETEQLEQAVEAYRAVQQTSSRFDEALYELAWTYIRIGDAIQAERALELLSVAAPESALNAEGQVLRGELLARNGRYDEAASAFDEVRSTFGPIRDELERRSLEHPDLRSYFRQVVRENLDSFEIDDFVPEPAGRWIDLEGDYGRALDVLASLSKAKELVLETDELAQRISATLNAPNGVSVFADLRRQRERTTGLRNRASRTRGLLIQSEARARGNRGANAERVRARRQELEAEVKKMPVETEDFVERDLEKLAEYQAAERELPQLRVEILGLEARIVASKVGLAAVDPNRVDPEALRVQLEGHESEIDAYEQQLTWIRRRLEVGRLHVGVGDKRYQADDAVRAKFIDVVDRERELAGSGGPEYDAAFSRVRAVERRLDQRDA